MSRDLMAALVETQARQDCDKVFLVRCVLLQETLAEEAGAGTRAANYLKENLSPVRSLPSRIVLEKATPFFRMNVHRCFTANREDERSLMDYSQNLVMMAVDSYFEHLPCDQPFHFQFEEQSHIVLPRLNLRVPVSAGDVTLKRTDATTIQLVSGNGELSIDLRNVPAEFRPLSFRVPCNSAILLAESNTALFEETYLSSIELDTKNVQSLIEQIDKALNLIALVDEKVSALINRYIEWYIPLVNENPAATHHSFSAKNLPGIMFLSGSYRFLPLCEAIVHEYHHYELYILTSTKNVFGVPTDRLFYSPWRTDARPLSGLFHALHVFTGVADFYSHAMKVNLPELEVFQRDIQCRRELLWHQLTIGLAQVPREDLPPLGQKIYDYMEQHLAVQKAELEPALRTPPTQILKHFDDWSALHPQLVSEVKLPAEFFSHANV